MLVQCISKRPDHSDLIYGTGKWNFEEIKDVPDDAGRKMLDHRDVYRRPAVAPDTPVAKVVPPTQSQDAPLQEFYDQLSVMTKDQARDFIETKFSMKVDMRKYPSEEAIRGYARMLVDQFGL
jgi:hypothetical protein